MTLQDEIKKAYEEWMIRDGTDIEAVCVQKGVHGNFTGGYTAREPEIASLREKIAELEECSVWQGSSPWETQARVQFSGTDGEFPIGKFRMYLRALQKSPIERVAEANGIDPAVLAKAVKELEEAGK